MSIVVPQDDTGFVPIIGLPELITHLEQLQTDDSIPIDAKLADDVELQLRGDNIVPLLPRILPSLTSVLRTTAQDPNPLLSLAIKLLSPLSFTEALGIANTEILVTALQSPLPGANLLALAVLRKACDSPEDAALLDTLPNILQQLVEIWLLSDDTGVSEKAAMIISGVLDADCPIPPVSDSDVFPLTNGFSHASTQVLESGRPRRRHHRSPGSGRLWHQFLENEAILGLIPRACSDSARTDAQRTVTQGRVLGLVAHIILLDFKAITKTVHPTILRVPEDIAQSQGSGLLQWVIHGMPDKSDLLVELSWLDFVASVVKIMGLQSKSEEDKLALQSILKPAADGEARCQGALRSLLQTVPEDQYASLHAFVMPLLN